MDITCISDLHGFYPKLPGGDLLIIAGDLTSSDTDEQHFDFIVWLASFQSPKRLYEKIIYIGGNHDNFFCDEARHGALNAHPDWNIEYLCDSGTEFKGMKIWGCPWTKTFEGMNPQCKAFTVDTEDELMDKFDLITGCPDILITHSPPYGVLDGIPNEDGSLFHAGSRSLFSWLKHVERTRLHVFGHIHEAYGKVELFATHNDKMMISVNASHVNERYKPVNKYIRIEI